MERSESNSRSRVLSATGRSCRPSVVLTTNGRIAPGRSPSALMSLATVFSQHAARLEGPMAARRAVGPASLAIGPADLLRKRATTRHAWARRPTIPGVEFAPRDPEGVAENRDGGLGPVVADEGESHDDSFPKKVAASFYNLALHEGPAILLAEPEVLAPEWLCRGVGHGDAGGRGFTDAPADRAGVNPPDWRRLGTHRSRS